MRLYPSSQISYTKRKTSTCHSPSLRSSPSKHLWLIGPPWFGCSATSTLSSPFRRARLASRSSSGHLSWSPPTASFQSTRSSLRACYSATMRGVALETCLLACSIYDKFGIETKASDGSPYCPRLECFWCKNKEHLFKHTVSNQRPNSHPVTSFFSSLQPFTVSTERKGQMMAWFRMKETSSTLQSSPPLPW